MNKNKLQNKGMFIGPRQMLTILLSAVIIMLSKGVNDKKSLSNANFDVSIKIQIERESHKIPY